MIERLTPTKLLCIGGGYVGLVSAICFAKMGHTVGLVEANPAKAEKIKNGQAPFFEKDLQTNLAEFVGKGKLKVFENLSDGLKDHPDFVFLCVGTPENIDGSADLSQVWAAVDDFISFVQGSCIFVCKSTVPVGVSEKIMQKIETGVACKLPKIQVGFAFVPEFLREGSAIEDFFAPDRIVVGCNDEQIEQKIKLLHRPILENGAKFFSMDFCSAELVKLSSNAMLALRVALINQISNLAQLVGADIDKVSQAVGADHRIGPDFLQAGLGFGGSCLPKDLASLAHICKDFGCSASIVEAVIQANCDQRRIFLDKFIEENGPIKGKKIGLIGLAFKPGTDDLRCSPALWIALELVKHGAQVLAYDEHCRVEQLLQLSKSTGEKAYESIVLTKNKKDLFTQGLLINAHKIDF